MNTALVYLIVTMGSHYGFSHQGYGGVSVTPTTNMEECKMLKQVVTDQIIETTNLLFDEREIIIQCKKGK